MFTSIINAIDTQIQIGQSFIDFDCPSNRCSNGITNNHCHTNSNWSDSNRFQETLTSFVKFFTRTTTSLSHFIAKIPDEIKSTCLSLTKYLGSETSS